MVNLGIVLIGVITFSALFILVMSDGSSVGWVEILRLEALATISIADIMLIILKIATPSKVEYISSIPILTVILCLLIIYFYRKCKKLKIATIIDIVAESEKYTEVDYKDLCRKLRCISKIKSKYKRLYKLHISPLYKMAKSEKAFTTNEVKEAFRNEILIPKIDEFIKAVNEAIDEIKVKDKELIRILSKI